MKKSTERRLKERRRDKLYELVRLSKMLWVPPWGGLNGVMPLDLNEWRDSVASVILVGHRARSAGTCGDSKDLRLKAAINKGQRVVRNKVRDRLLLWERFLFLLAQLREEEFVSSYCQGNKEVVYLTILDFPSIIVPTLVLKQIARRLLPRGNGSFSRTRFEKKKRSEEKLPRRFRTRWKSPPRKKGWMSIYLKELEETWGNEPETPTVHAENEATAAELKKLCQKLDGQRHFIFSSNGSGANKKASANGAQGKKKKTARKKAVVAKRSGAKPAARAPKATRSAKHKQKA